MNFTANKFIELTLALAKQAADKGEIPVGAVITDEKNNIIAQAHNETIAQGNSLKHAEMLALEQAFEYLKKKQYSRNRLENCNMYVSLEPCAMCAGAIANARIKNLYYAATDNKGGAVENGARVFSHPNCNHKPNIVSGIMEKESQEILSNYFKKLRDEN